MHGVFLLKFTVSQNADKYITTFHWSFHSISSIIFSTSGRSFVFLKSFSITASCPKDHIGTTELIDKSQLLCAPNLAGILK